MVRKIVRANDHFYQYLGPPRLLSWLILCSFLFSCKPVGQTGTPCPAVEVEYPGGNYIVPGSKAQIPYRELGQRKLYLDAYIQIQPDREVRPGVIVIHGDGWTAGNRVSFVGQWLEMLTLAGFNWFSLDYRLAPEGSYDDPHGMENWEGQERWQHYAAL